MQDPRSGRCRGLTPHFEALADPQCEAYNQKLLAALPGGSGPVARASSQVKAKSKSTSKSTSKSKASKSLSKSLEALRLTSRETLLAKPTKVLHELLRELGTSCRGCSEKSELVDRLREVAEL